MFTLEVSLSQVNKSQTNLYHMCKYSDTHTHTHACRDIVAISHVTYRKLDELKCSTQPVKIICGLDPFETQIERCE